MRKNKMDDNTYAFVYCPDCGFGFKHKLSNTGKTIGRLGGAVAGATLGAKSGIAGGPLGAMAGTIPCAILMAIFGSNAGKGFDNPQCPKCSVKFSLPKKIGATISKSPLQGTIKQRILARATMRHEQYELEAQTPSFTFTDWLIILVVGAYIIGQFH